MNMKMINIASNALSSSNFFFALGSLSFDRFSPKISLYLHGMIVSFHFLRDAILREMLLNQRHLLCQMHLFFFVIHCNRNTWCSPSGHLLGSLHFARIGNVYVYTFGYIEESICGHKVITLNKFGCCLVPWCCLLINYISESKSVFQMWPTKWNEGKLNGKDWTDSIQDFFFVFVFLLLFFRSFRWNIEMVKWPIFWGISAHFHALNLNHSI